MKKIEILLIIILFFVLASKVKAGIEHNVSGWAWSENIGWISFNCYNDYDGDGILESHCTDEGYPSNYGVNLDTQTGLFSGYAWSEHIGWISFNESELSGCPQPPCRAWLDLSNNRVYGWARALAFGGGWDGWIHLNGTTTNGTSYGVTFNSSTNKFEGWAWGGDDTSPTAVIGWISFHSVKKQNRPPSIGDKSVDISSSMVICGQTGGSRAYFSWQFLDLDPEDFQGAYQIQISTNSNFNNILIDTQKILSSSQSFLLDNPFGLLDWNTTYYWRIKVWDNHDLASNWIVGGSFQTPTHSYPAVDFRWFPRSPRIGEEIQFEDMSETFGGTTISSWRWTFEDGTTTTYSSQQHPTTTFRTLNPKVTLKVTDSDGFSCEKTVILQQRIPFPFFKEIQSFFYETIDKFGYFLHLLQNLVSGRVFNLLSSIFFPQLSHIP